MYKVDDYSEDEIAELMAAMTDEERLAFEGLRRQFAPVKSVLTAPDPLMSALNACLEARKTIPKEQAKVRKLLDKSRSEVEYQARLYQIDLIELQLNRAADIAEKRIKYLGSISNRKREIAKIADGVKGAIHWFEYYAWGYDPRADSGLALTPLALFERQKQYIEWLEETVFLYRTSGVVPKSRDMGATVMSVDWAVLKWLAVPGFAALMSSRKDSLVDSTQAKDTLFEKARMQLRLLPKWMMPEHFVWSRDSKGMGLANPDNGSELNGEAPVRNFGRQQRATVVIMDEFAAWPDGGYLQKDSAAGGTTKSIIEISSVKGKFNQFYEDWIAEHANVFLLNWKDHPWKDTRWYNSLPFGFIGPKMSKELIAQEIDMDPDASQPGRVWPMYNEVYSVVPMMGIRRAFAKYNIYFPDDGDGRPRVPADCEIARFNDRGATAGHRNAWLWVWRPREHQPFADSVFVFREWLAPIGATFRTIVDNVRMFESADDEEEKVVVSQNSHEAESERINYSVEYGLEFEGWKTDYESGIAQIGEFLTVIDTDKENPFKPEIKGRTRLILVVQDGQGELKKMENEMWQVVKATDHLGLSVIREQIAGYHYPPEEAGKPVAAMRPQKKADDTVDCLRACALVWGDLVGEKSDDEILADKLKALNPNFVPEEIDKLVGWERQGRLAAMNQARRRLEKEEESASSTGSALLDWQERLRSRSYI